MCYSAMVERNMKRLASRFDAAISIERFRQYQLLVEHEQTAGPGTIKAELGLARIPKSSQFKWAPDEASGRVYPNYFAPVLVGSGVSGRELVPMRYRLRPHGMPKEIPSKYNVFNARRDGLLTRPTWKKLFGRNHAVFPFYQFYEWVEADGRKVEVKFSPDARDIMWAPALYDSWSSHDGTISFSSFAMVTDEPPPEVAAAGHDRCPVFLKESVIDQWLNPHGRTKEELLSLLDHRESVYFNVEQAGGD